MITASTRSTQKKSNRQVIKCVADVKLYIHIDELFELVLYQEPPSAEETSSDPHKKRRPCDDDVYRYMPLHEKIHYIYLFQEHHRDSKLKFSLLDLRQCGILEKTVPSLNSLIQFNAEFLRVIDLSNNDIKDVQGAEIIEAIGSCNNLVELYLHDNSLGTSSMNALQTYMQPSLLTLCVISNQMPVFSSAQFERVPNLKKLYIDSVHDVSSLKHLSHLKVANYTEHCVRSTWVLPNLVSLEGNVSPAMQRVFDIGRSDTVNRLLLLCQVGLPLDAIKYMLTF